MRNLRAIAVMAMFLAITLPLMPLQWLFLKLGLRQAKTFPHHYHRWVCRILGVRLAAVGQVPGGSALLVSNHVSWLDIPVLSAIRPMSFIAKKQVGSWPFFGSLARLQHSVFVNREARHSTAASRNEIAARLQNNHALVLFAEGTSGSGKELRPFKSSFFASADQVAVPVVPVTLVYYRLHGLPLTVRQRPLVAWYGDMDLLPHLWGVIKNGPLSVKVILHPPLNPNEFGNRKMLSAAAEAVVRNGLAEALHGSGKMG